MRERPILFAGPMVRAILNGEKTVTRRLMKPQPDFLGSMVDPNTPFKTLGAGLHARITCPYGEPGDRLWVRETFATLSAGQYEPVKPAHGYGQDVRFAATDPLTDCDVGVRGYAWRPSIHMPRWASRILLEITAVRVERLQDISDEQCVAEGIGVTKHAVGVKLTSPHDESVPRAMFRELWQSINGAESWAANPWVWVVEFRRIAA